MADPAAPLKNLQPKHKFFIGIDSDGCAFDTMEIKHKECFCPNYIKHWELQPVSKYARDIWEFVNLYSTWRGCNRYIALLKAFDLLAEHPKVQARKVSAPDVPSLRDWVANETKLGNPVLEAKVNETKDPILEKTLVWSKAVNTTVGEMVYGCPPFPKLPESLERLSTEADMVVVSQTPVEALEREWEEHGIAKYVEVIAGQELGTKTEHLRFATTDRYEADRVLMIGDAPGDFKAAKANNALFYPIKPGEEEASWERFHDEAIDKFLGGTYAGDYEKSLIDEFNKILPDKMDWQK